MIFKNLQKGEYLVVVIHDQNNNKHLDFNFLGIPTEKVAVSNGAIGFLGPPDYKDGKFTLNKDTTITIKF